MSFVIKSGTIITTSETFQADILVQGEKIIRLGIDLHEPDAEVIDATGKLIMPGGVDVHTHFDLPMFGTVSSDDHYSGHKAAAFGGTTTVIDFVPQVSENLLADVEKWHEKADPKAAVDFGFHMNITHFDESIGSQIPCLVDQGITTLKVFTAYNNRLRLQDGEIFRVLKIARQHGMLVMLHAENGDVIDYLIQQAIDAGETKPIWHAKTRPSWGAVEATLRGIALAAQAEAPIYIVHVNTAGEADMIQYARQKGLQVMGETCPQYLFFTEDHLDKPDGAKWVCSPPLRRKEDNLRLWEAVANGTLISMGTDHCPFFYDGSTPIVYEGKPIRIPGKELGNDDFTRIPNGLPGVGDRLPVLWSYGVCQGKLTPHQFVAINCSNPARIFGLYPKKGAILPGSDADIVLWDPDKHITYGVNHAQHRTDYNLYEGWELAGYPEQVFLRGKLIVDRGEWLGYPGQGKYQIRLPGAEVI